MPENPSATNNYIGRAKIGALCYSPKSKVSRKILCPILLPVLLQDRVGNVGDMGIDPLQVAQDIQVNGARIHRLLQTLVQPERIMILCSRNFLDSLMKTA